jgi:hypothetical protein
MTQGQRHTVTVTTYPSLSAIARAITGTAWSGPRFFALSFMNVTFSFERMRSRSRSKSSVFASERTNCAKRPAASDAPAITVS